MKETKMIFCVILLAALIGPAQAAQEFWRSDLPNLTVRQAEAKELLNTFQSLEKQIPMLSPSEKAWLQREIDEELASGKYTPRALRAMDSTEYNIRTAHRYLETLTNALSALSERKFSDTKQEVRLWTIAAHTMAEHSLWQSVRVLVDKKIVGEKIGHVDNFYFENFVLQAQGILEKVVIHYLDGTLPAPASQ